MSVSGKRPVPVTKKPNRVLGWLLKPRIKTAIHPASEARFQSIFTRSFSPARIGRFTVMPFVAKSSLFASLSLFKGAGLVGHPFFHAAYEVLQEGLPRKVRSSASDWSERVSAAFPSGRGDGGVCFVMTLQGKKGAGGLYRSFHEAVRMHPADFLLRELCSHAQKMGLRGIALLRPEKNPWLWMHSRSEIQGISRQYYSAARSSGFKKVKGSPFLWKVFDA